MKLTEKIKELASYRGVSESEILEQAIERGVDEMWAESVLSKYVEGEIDTERAVELVSLDRVKRADRGRSRRGRRRMGSERVTVGFLLSFSADSRRVVYSGEGKYMDS
jgi:hypothetical protein